MLRGRADEEVLLDGVAADARAGRSGVLVVRGEAGIGKTALLSGVSDRATGMRVLRGTGVQAETPLAYAGLHQLLRGSLDRLDALPVPQAAALRRAFGMTEGALADWFLVGLATLSLLGELAEERPLLVLVDDAQWLDRASAETLLFAARRLDADGVAMIFAARDGAAFDAHGIQELRLRGIDRSASVDLLAEHFGDLADHVRERVLAEAHGNPLALLELPAALSPGQRAGELPPTVIPVGIQPLSTRLEQTFYGRVVALPHHTREVLLVAATDDTGDLDVVLRAARRLGVGPEALAAAEDAGLVRVSADRLDFTHPLIRSATYRGVSAHRRAAAHRALAEETTVDRRAWHLAAATVGTDDTVADELERHAEHTRARAGFAAAAATYRRAARLTSEPARRGHRLAAAALAAASSGQPRFAMELAQEAMPLVTDTGARAELARVRAELAHVSDVPPPDGELMDAAAGLATSAPDTTALMVLDAMAATWTTGNADRVADLAGRVADLPPASPLLKQAAAVVDRLSADDLEEALPRLRALLEDVGADIGRGLWERVNIVGWHHWLADLEAAHDDNAAVVRACRSEAAVGLLPRALMHLGRAQLMLGRYRDARVTATEGLRISRDVSQPHFADHLVGQLAWVAAVEGDEERCLTLTEEVLSAGLSERGLESLYARCLLDVAHGRYEAVLRRLDEITPTEGQQLAMSYTYTVPEYVESAVRVGRHEQAAALFAWFDGWSAATGQPWVRAVALRCRALLRGDDPRADDVYRHAVDLHRRSAVPFERARTELLYGEWLRRTRRRSDSRPHLRSAMETFDRLGATPWADRARTELRATGETPTRVEPRTELLDLLTPQELQVVRLAAAGLTNRDIGAQLFLSPRTVGYHLYKAYPKLGVSSRGDLARMDLG